MDEMQEGKNIDNKTNNSIPVHFIGRNEQDWTDRGNAAAQQGDYEAAVEAFEQAVTANPNDARARVTIWH
jgi:Flp pilus assembly protein TadD